MQMRSFGGRYRSTQEMQINYDRDWILIHRSRKYMYLLYVYRKSFLLCVKKANIAKYCENQETELEINNSESSTNNRDAVNTQQITDSQHIDRIINTKNRIHR